MYGDHSPLANGPTQRVVVVEEGDTDADALIRLARKEKAVTKDGRDDVYWVVFSSDPGRLWDMTEKALRHEFKSKSR